MTSPESLSLGNDISQAAADDENFTSSENGTSLSGTENDMGTSTSSSVSDVVVSDCAFPQIPTGSDLQEVRCEEGSKNDSDLILKLGKSYRRKREEKSVKEEKATTRKPTKRSNTYASRRGGGKCASDTTTPIPAPKMCNIGDKCP